MGGGVVLMLPCPPEAEPKLQSRQRRKGQTGSEVRGGFFLVGGELLGPPSPPPQILPPLFHRGKKMRTRAAVRRGMGEGGAL